MIRIGILFFNLLISTPCSSAENIAKTKVRESTVIGNSMIPVENGLLILELEKNSVYDKLGLKKGDILKSINGKKLTKSNTIITMSTFLGLKTTDRITVVLERRKKVETLTWNIEPKH